MNRSITTAAAMLVCVGLGAAVVKGLHAQAKPPAFQISEITITNDEAYNKEFVPLIVKSIRDSGGKFIVRGGKVTNAVGLPPERRVVVLQFDSLDKAQAWIDSPARQAAQAIGEKYATFRGYQVEGVSP